MVAMRMASPGWCVPVMMATQGWGVPVRMASPGWGVPVMRCGWRIVMIVPVSSNCGTCRTAESTTNNGAVTPTDLIANCCTRSATKGTTNCCIQSRIVSVRFNS